MAGPRGKRKAEASQTGDLLDQPKTRRGETAAAAPPPGFTFPARGAPCVHTREDMMAFDVIHTLRSGRKVFVPNTDKPGPMRFRKGEKPVYDMSWQTPACAKVALENYNRLNEDEYVLVKAVVSKSFFYNGPWMHANFIAKPIGDTRGLGHKRFFAELKIGPEGKEKMSCVSCIKMDPDDPETAPVFGCRICPGHILHPAAGKHRGGTSGSDVA